MMTRLRNRNIGVVAFIAMVAVPSLGAPVIPFGFSLPVSGGNTPVVVKGAGFKHTVLERNGPGVRARASLETEKDPATLGDVPQKQVTAAGLEFRGCVHAPPQDDFHFAFLAAGAEGFVYTRATVPNAVLLKDMTALAIADGMVETTIVLVCDSFQFVDTKTTMNSSRADKNNPHPAASIDIHVHRHLAGCELKSFALALIASKCTSSTVIARGGDCAAISEIRSGGATALCQ